MQVPEDQWREGTYVPDLTFGSMRRGPQSRGEPPLNPQMAIAHLQQALRRRPNGSVVVSTTRRDHLQRLSLLPLRWRPLDQGSCRDDGRTEITAKVCIIGAGIAGLLTAWRLNSKGIPAVLLESGPRDADDAVHPLNAVEQLGQDYKGATRGRFRCLGGTSTRWGGQLVPIAPDAMEPRPYLGLPGWPVSADELSSLFARRRVSLRR